MNMDLILLYEKHRDMLLAQQQEAIEELWFMQVKQLTLGKEERIFMSEVMNLITYLNSCINVTENKIKKLNRILLGEEA